MNKNITFSNEAREKLVAGVNKLANSVRATLGPKGRNVLIDTGMGAPMVTKDGVTVARSINLEDPIERLGANLVKEVASRTNEQAGDGTTSSSLLAQAIISEGMRHVMAGSNVQAIKRGIDKSVEALVAEIKRIAQPVDDLAMVASISANDKYLGGIVADITSKVGENGIILVEDSPVIGIDTDVVKGFRVDKGYLSPAMANSPDGSAILEDPMIFVTDGTITTFEEFAAIADGALKAQNKNLVIFCNDMEASARASLLANMQKGNIRAIVVKPPNHDKSGYLEDIATVTGAFYFSIESGRLIDSITEKDFGRASKVIATREDTTIIDAAGTQEAIGLRTALLKASLEDKKQSNMAKDRLQERIATLSGGIGVIRVAAATETETMEIKHRLEDAIRATRSAQEEGIVPGGGVALIKASKVLETIEDLTGDEKIGRDIIIRAIEWPLMHIAENAGKTGITIVDKVKEDKRPNSGYDAFNDVYVDDLVALGIIDPAKVTRCALQNAASAATMILTTESVVSIIEKD